MWCGVVLFYAVGVTERMIRVSAILLQDSLGCILTVRKRGTSMRMLPGGKLEPGEALIDAARRECSEEVGLEVPAAEIIEFGRFEADAANETGFRVTSTVFRCTRVIEHGEVTPLAEIEDLVWVDPQGSYPNLAPLLRGEIFPAIVASRA